VNILERILEAKRAEVAAAKEMLGEAAVAARARAQSPPRDFTGALRAKLAAGRPAVIGEIKRDNVKLILVQPFQNRKTAETVARQTGAAVVDAPQQPGAANNTSSYFDNMDNLVRAIAAALGGKK